MDILLEVFDALQVLLDNGITISGHFIKYSDMISYMLVFVFVTLVIGLIFKITEY